MPIIEITYERPSGEIAGDAYDNARKLLEVEKANHPELLFVRDPSWVETSTSLVATLPGTINSEYVAPVIEETPIEEPVPVEDAEPKPKRKFTLRRKK